MRRTVRRREFLKGSVLAGLSGAWLGGGTSRAASAPPQLPQAAGRLRITDLKVFGVTLDPRSDRPYVFVKIETDAGVVGWGEATLEGKAGATIAAVKDIKELAALKDSLAQPTIEKATAYAKSVYDVTTATQAELGALVEQQVSEFNKQVVTALDKMVKTAPAGSEVGVAAVKSAITAVNAAYDNLSKVAKQFADVTQSNIEAVLANLPYQLHGGRNRLATLPGRCVVGRRRQYDPNEAWSRWNTWNDCSTRRRSIVPLRHHGCAANAGHAARRSFTIGKCLRSAWNWTCRRTTRTASSSRSTSSRRRV